LVSITIPFLQSPLPLLFTGNCTNKVTADERARKYIIPQKIVWKSDTAQKLIKGAENLLTRLKRAG
jgi:hypothetical protein